MITPEWATAIIAAITLVIVVGGLIANYLQQRDHLKTGAFLQKMQFDQFGTKLSTFEAHLNTVSAELFALRKDVNIDNLRATVLTLEEKNRRQGDDIHWLINMTHAMKDFIQKERQEEYELVLDRTLQRVMQRHNSESRHNGF